MDQVLNVSAYCFAALPDAAALQLRLTEATQRLRGTILLAPEGINLVLAGAPEDVRGVIDLLRRDTRFAALPVKESWSRETPFRRMRVKLKPEIIRMNRPAIRPQAGRAPALAAAHLKRWLDQGHDDAGRPVVMLDTRNAFEVDQGRFDGAVDWRLQRFSDFPAALEAQRQQLAGKTVVTYCTGGIRCEKAALLMAEQGLDAVWQLDGGILKYFESVEAAPHWQGECFVFDERIALDPDLTPA